jgi:2-amino-4-hydroxy-6-hydroxymethyldihydropteridine diphosphokinase
MKTDRVFLSLGTNVGDREANLSRAAELLSGAGLKVVGASGVYETEPVGVLDQPLFLNQVLEVSPSVDLPGMLRACLAVEDAMGRVRERRNGPRVIDCDLLLYGGRIVSDVDLVVPHPRLHERGFVMIPLAEIAPEVVHPVFAKTIASLAAERDWTGSVRRWTGGGTGG